MKLAEIDKNFAIPSNIGRDDVVWFDIDDEPFRIYGVTKSKDGRYIRMPDEVAKNVSDGVHSLITCTAGGRVRFSTDSPFIAIKTEQPLMEEKNPRMTNAMKNGFDLFINKNGKAYFTAAFVPECCEVGGFEQLKETHSGGKMIDYTMNFPLYGRVNKVLVGIKEGSHIDSGAEYEKMKPIVYYGSSITQGACASRPGTCYEALISQMYNLDYINLGFSGCCKGEIPMAEYLAGLDMSIFVCDYDHNAPSAEYLRETHGRLYDIIRAKHPNVPYIMITKPDCYEYNRTDVARRREVVYETFMRAVKSDDKNVYFIDGERLFDGDGRDNCTAEGCHPTDLGFYCMSRAIGEVIRQIIVNNKEEK